MTPNEQALPEQALKACPFCGGEAQVASYNSCDCCGKAWNGQVICQKCRASRDHFDTDEEAIAAWNIRPAVSDGAGERIARLLPVEDGRFCMTISEGGDVTDIYEGPLIAVIRWALNLGLEMHLPALSQPASGGVASAEREALEQAFAIADASPELNMSNYDHDQVHKLNEAMIEVHQILRAALAAPGQDEGVGS